MKQWVRLLALLLAFALTLSGTAFAAESDPVSETMPEQAEETALPADEFLYTDELILTEELATEAPVGLEEPASAEQTEAPETELLPTPETELLPTPETEPLPAVPAAVTAAPDAVQTNPEPAA